MSNNGSLRSKIEGLRPYDSTSKIDSLIALVQERKSVLDCYWDKLICSFINDPFVLEYYNRKKSALKFSKPATEAIPFISDLLVSLHPVDNAEKVDKLYKELRDSEFPLSNSNEGFVRSKIKGAAAQKRWQNNYIGGKEIKIEVLDFSKYKAVVVPQPLATLLVYGVLDRVSFSNYYTLHENDLIHVYATEFSPDMMYRVENDIKIYGKMCNGLNTGSFDNIGFPENCFIGTFVIGKKISKGVEQIVSPSICSQPIETDVNNNPTNYRHITYKPKIKHLNRMERTIVVPTDEETWNLVDGLNGSVYYYWEDEFSQFVIDYDIEEFLRADLDYDEEEDSRNGMFEGRAGDENGLFDILFVNGDKKRRFLQKNETAIKKQLLTSIYGDYFSALIIDFEKLTEAPQKIESSFEILQQKDWILDWNCVNFKQGYFIVTQPDDGSVKFKPEAVSAPGVLVSYNFLKDYLNDRLPSIHCSVESMKLTIYDKIRLNEAIDRLASISRQRGIVTTNSVANRKNSPTQVSFSQALSKAQQMTPEEFRKYKSKYIDFLVSQQSKKYKIIPCVERMSYSNSDITEYAFIFSVECHSDSILIVHENVNPDRSTLLFVVNKCGYDKAIRSIYDFMQSAEINKRSNLRDRTIEIEDANIKRYRSINHDYLLSWQNVISIYRHF